MMLHTTLTALKENDACTEGYQKLLKHVGLRYPQDKPIELATILESNGLSDTLWSFRAVPVEQFDYARKVLSLYTADCLEIIVKGFGEEFTKEFPKIAEELRQGPGLIRSYWRGEIGKKEITVAYDLAYLAYRADRADLADRADRAYLAYLADRADRADLADLADSAGLTYHADRAKCTSILMAYLKDTVDLSHYTRDRRDGK